MNSSNTQQTDTPTETLASETTIERFTPPRLGIAHLLIWTAAAAVLLKLDMATGYLGKLMGPQFKHVPQLALIIERCFCAISDMMLAAGLLGTGVIVVTRIHGGKGRLQPGHWLMIACTFSAVVQTGGRYVNIQDLVLPMCGEDLLNNPYTRTIILTAIKPFVIRLVGVTGIYLWAAFRCKSGWHWTAALCLLPTIELIHAVRLLGLPSLGVLVMIMSYTRLVIPGLAVLGAVVVDLYKGLRRDWLHWTGVGIVVVPMLLAIGRLAIYLVYFKDS